MSRWTVHLKLLRRSVRTKVFGSQPCGFVHLFWTIFWTCFTKSKLHKYKKQRSININTDNTDRQEMLEVWHVNQHSFFAASQPTNDGKLSFFSPLTLTGTQHVRPDKHRWQIIWRKKTPLKMALTLKLLNRNDKHYNKVGSCEVECHLTAFLAIKEIR